MPVEPPHEHRTPRGTWSRRAAQGSAAALAALSTLGTVGAAHAAPEPAPAPDVAQHQRASHVTVARGDSLWSLAATHGVGVKELMRANDVPAHGMIRPGERLVLPADPAKQDRTDRPSGEAGGARDHAAEHSAAEPSDGGRTRHHSVVAGDTLWDLSHRYGVSVSRLLSANSLSPAEVLRPGRTLSIPSAEGAGEPDRAASSAAREGGAEKPSGASAPVGNSFAGRTYPEKVVASANAHHAQLQKRQVPPPGQIRQMVAQTARDMGVDPALALAHASQESGFRHEVVSPADAVGTMQVIPSAGEWASALVGRELDLLDPQDNITAGVAIIRELQDKAPSKAAGIGAYYQGLHGVKTYGMYSDTKAYVKAVRAQERAFAQ